MQKLLEGGKEKFKFLSFAFTFTWKFEATWGFLLFNIIIVHINFKE